jgi:hypothetical protein
VTPSVPNLVEPPINQPQPTETPVKQPTTGNVTSPAPIVPEAPVKPQEEPIKQEVKTETPAVPQKVPETAKPPKGFEYGNMMDTKTGLPQLVNTAEAKRQKELAKNKSLYTNGKSIYDAINSQALLP